MLHRLTLPGQTDGMTDTPVDRDDVIEASRKQAVLANAVHVHGRAFDTAVAIARVADPADTFGEADKAPMVQAEKQARTVLSRLAKQHGSTTTKALAEAEDRWLRELRDNLAAWTQALYRTEDMLAHPEEYGDPPLLLDGRPMDLDQLAKDKVAYQAVIAAAEKHLAEVGSTPDK